MLEANVVWKALVEVNADVNRMPYKSDPEMYGRPDFWSSKSADAGDCDDYACQKRRMLREKFPDNLDALMLATCWVEGEDGPGTGGYHAVLLVNTDKGAYVLDNRYPKVKPWPDLPYRWDKREVVGADHWTTF